MSLQFIPNWAKGKKMLNVEIKHPNNVISLINILISEWRIKKLQKRLFTKNKRSLQRKSPVRCVENLFLAVPQVLL